MKTIHMEGAYDSAAACLSMALGVADTAKEMHAWLGYDPNGTELRGVYLTEVVGVLYAAGLNVKVYQSAEDLVQLDNHDLGSMRKRLQVPSEQWLCSKLGAQRAGCAIAVVPVMGSNAPNTGHYVFCKSGEVYDPSNGNQRYIGASSSLPVKSVIFIYGSLLHG